jgi:hypothetical protein
MLSNILKRVALSRSLSISFLMIKAEKSLFEFVYGIMDMESALRTKKSYLNFLEQLKMIKTLTKKELG